MKKVARLRATPNEDAAGGAEHVGVRTTGRIKKPKAVFDPSDNYLPRAQRGSIQTTPSSGTGAAAAGTSILIERKKDTPTSQQGHHDSKRTLTQSTSSSTATTTKTPTATTAAGTDPPPETKANTDICEICQKGEAKRGIYAKNKLISCLDCERRVHKLCLPVDFEDIDNLRQNYKCDSCRTCDVCDAFTDCQPKINQPMVTCSKCIKSYHLTCHIPNVFKFQQIFRWKCNKCMPVVNNNGQALPVKTIREIIGDEPKRTPTPQQQEPEKQKQQTPSQQQHPPKVNIAAAAEEAKSAAAAKRTLQQTKSNEKVPEKRSTNGAKAAKDLDRASSGGLSASSSSSSGSSASSSNSDSSSGSSTSSQITRRSAEGRVADSTIAAKKPKTTNNNDVIPTNNVVNTPTPLIRYSPYEPIDVPDVKDWNVDQVAAYFAKYFPNEAHVFKEHEIDGTSLLLLKRSDVIKKLPIKLGPSLRIYSLILKIQTQLNDPTLGWNCGL